MTVFPIPAPMMLMHFVKEIPLSHIALPGATLIVSPFFARLTQRATEVLSGVDDHVGLEPVQADQETIGTERKATRLTVI